MILLQSGIDEARAYRQARAWVERHQADYDNIDNLLADCPVYAPEGMIREIVESMEASNE